MIMIITLTLSILVAVNFLLLIFSCNKSTKKITAEQPKMKKSPKVVIPTKQLASTQQLAPTGS